MKKEEGGKGKEKERIKIGRREKGRMGAKGRRRRKKRREKQK